MARSAGVLKRGSVYITLGEIEERGFLRRSLPAGRSQGPRLARPTYVITATGSRILQAVDLTDPKLLGALS